MTYVELLKMAEFRVIWSLDIAIGIHLAISHALWTMNMNRGQLPGSADIMYIHMQVSFVVSSLGAHCL